MSRLRLPDQVALNLRLTRGQDAYWALIMDLGRSGGTFSLSDIHRGTGTIRQDIKGHVTRWVRSGHLERMDRGRYRLARPSREAPRVRRDGTELPETGRDRMWRAMKMLDLWTVPELSEETRTETLPPVPLPTARAYVADLAGVGIVQLLERKRAPRASVYRLIRNIGAAAPRILVAHVVYDPNSHTIIGPATAKEVL